MIYGKESLVLFSTDCKYPHELLSLISESSDCNFTIMFYICIHVVGFKFVFAQDFWNDKNALDPSQRTFSQKQQKQTYFSLLRSDWFLLLLNLLLNLLRKRSKEFSQVRYSEVSSDVTCHWREDQ